MILVDTSAWIELLRATGHPPHVSLRHHLERRTPLAATEPIIMELLAGTRTGGERSRLRARLIALPRLTVRGSPTSSRWPNCTASAAAGRATVRTLMDCLIAAVAIREQVTVLHNDRDYEVLATRLRTERYRALRVVPSR